MKHILSYLLFPLTVLGQDLPRPVTDDFGDGGLEGWSCNNNGTETCENVQGALEIGDLLGGGDVVVSAIYEALALEDFVLEVDLLPNSEDGQIAPNSGLYGRWDSMTNSGYGSIYRRDRSLLELYAITNRSLNFLGGRSVDVKVAGAVRLVMTGKGNELTTKLVQIGEVIAEVRATHDEHRSGHGGVALYFPGGDIARFDNFRFNPFDPPLLGSDPELRVENEYELGQLPAVPEPQPFFVSLHNAGQSKNLTISSASFEGADGKHFDVPLEELPFSIAPGDTEDFALSFQSLGETGAFDSVLKLKTNDTQSFEGGVVSINITASIINPLEPVAHYRMDESVLLIMHDATGFDRSGTYVNGVTVGEKALAGGTAIKIEDGASAVVEGAVFGENAFEAFTLSLWFQSLTDSPGALIGKGVPGDLAFGLIIDEQRKLSWLVDEEADLRSDPTTETLTTYHAAVSYETERVSLYLNGILTGGIEMPRPIGQHDDYPLRIGALGALGFNGFIDDVQIYDRALTSDEVDILFSNPGEPIQSEAPVDSDSDGLSDADEDNIYQTDPLKADTDEDGLTDGEEVHGDFATNPLNSDTDGDGFGDGFEVAQNADPSDPSSLPADVLGEPDQAWRALGSLPTFNNFEGGADRKDVTFRAFIDFENYQSSEEESEIIWEAGAGTIGFSLVYEGGNRLVLRAAGNAGFSVATVEHTLTQSQIEAGELSVIWTFDVDNGQSPESQTIALYLDEALVGDANSDLGPDWSGTNAAAFGVFGSIFAAGGNNTALDNGVEFKSGTIDLERGLQMFVDTLFEPVGQPESPKARILGIVRTHSAIQLELSGSEGTTVDLEYSPSFLPGSWEVVMSEITLTIPTTVIEDSNVERITERKGFYRLNW